MILEKGNNRNSSSAYKIHLYPRRGARIKGETMLMEVELEDKGLAVYVAVVRRSQVRDRSNGEEVRDKERWKGWIAQGECGDVDQSTRWWHR